MISRSVVIASSVGLHARPAAVLADAVDESGVDIVISFDGEEADAASLLEIMTLGVKHGDEVTLSTEDDNAGAVLDSLAKLLSRDLDQE
ncbi:HPr family phosphocarrier protein [Actinomycetaceae bacterium UMB8039B]|uniref:HPr family phosphocarrier protein n=1 Tax=unclassified Pauljensenia TaxID=2908895 RepID=UPI000B2A79A9|nr:MULTISPECIES: HPr family phosphocarrier protein [unclassified Pauljensenia]MDK7780317.1 HPr family phosphocarrier protein [Actinomycetaceae bacterium UMB8041B]MDK8293217.1 HPr family phosphocarrier protein [Actinomycetaceae bacterium UMB8039B]MDK8608663.1 HPr family phosphocarrier protein [Actinomycetaceae bacterium UMB8041A]MDK8752594.1 HPr family phosphocarrier protein [Actinomycetaceae bacterium UMB8039A]MDK6830944.1 HPr family phosphocarrier protein [Pauljensenia sp. UMB8040A]